MVCKQKEQLPPSALLSFLFLQASFLNTAFPFVSKRPTLRASQPSKTPPFETLVWRPWRIWLRTFLFFPGWRKCKEVSWAPGPKERFFLSSLFSLPRLIFLFLRPRLLPFTGKVKTEFAKADKGREDLERLLFSLLLLSPPFLFLVFQ